MDVQQWVTARTRAPVLHLDAAACGRVSRATLTDEIWHLEDEARGGYVSEAAAEPATRAGREALGAMVGLSGADVAFTESGSTAFAALLACWPLARGARIGTAGSEFGGNAAVLSALARERGWELVPLPADGLGRIEHVPADLDLVTFPQVASHRGVAQPVQLALDSGVPLLLDVAQSLGQCAVPPGAAAYVGTSRKWLCGPRGVGFLAIDPRMEPQLAAPPTLVPTLYDGARRFDSGEAHIAGRVGLATALAEWTPGLIPVVHARAAAFRRALAGLGGWRVVEPADEPTGITTLVPPPGVDPVAVREALLQRSVLVSVVPTTRAADMTAPLLRVSTHAWVAEDDADTLVTALAEVGAREG